MTGVGTKRQLAKKQWQSAYAVEPTFRDTCSTTRNKAQMGPSSKLFLTEYNVTLGTDINIRLRYV